MPTNVYVENNYAFIANFPSDFVILDVSNPGQPVHVSRAWWPIHSIDVVPSGNYAYSACQEFGLEVYHISNPRTPTLIGSSDSLGFLLNLDISAEYAYLTCIQHGLYIIDISQPSAPEITGNYHVPNVYSLVETAGSYAFVADTNGGFAAIDISDPAAPNVAARFDTADTGRMIFIDGNMLYSLSDHPPSRALRIYDISNPASPVVVGSYPTGFRDGTLADGYFYVTNIHPSLKIIDVHDPAHPALAGSYDIGDTVVYMTEVAGNYAYLFGGWTHHRILDISDRSHPALIGSFSTTPGVNTSNILGNFIYLSLTSDSLLVLDISNPVSPVQLNAIRLSGPSGARRGVKIIGNRLIAFSKLAVMEIFDISDPASPVLIDSLPLYGLDFALRNEYLYEADREFTTWHLNLTGMEDNPGRLPSAFSIWQNYPNPFNARTTISYDLPASAKVTVEIFNILGEKIETLVNEYQLAGSHQIIWNASKAASGVYMCRIKAGASMATEKMLLIK